MSNYGSKDIAFLLVSGYDITSLLPGGFDDGGSEAILDEITSVGDSWPRSADTASRKNLGLKLMALYDDATAKTRDVFVEKQGLARVIVWAVAGNTIGKRFVGFMGVIGQKVSRIASDGKLHRANIDYAGSGVREEGAILHALSAEVAAANTQSSSRDWAADVRARNAVILTSSIANPTVITTSGPHGLTTGDVAVIAGHAGSDPVINGEQTVTVISDVSFSLDGIEVTTDGTGGTVTQASTPGGGSGYIACSALTLGGYTNVIGKVRHSVDNSTFADLITFTAITAAPAAERKTVTTTVNRYLASSVAFSGSGSSPSVTFMIGFCRAVDKM